SRRRPRRRVAPWPACAGSPTWGWSSSSGSRSCASKSIGPPRPATASRCGTWTTRSRRRSGVAPSPNCWTAHGCSTCACAMRRRAMARLAVIVPTSIALIFILLFSAFGSTKYASLILVNLPFALIGGIAALWGRHLSLSVSAAVGFIALFGISVQNGVLLVGEFNRVREAGAALEEAVRRGAMERLRPVVMTALMAALGLLPAALSRGVGAETTRPFASVIVGGMVSSTVLTLLLLPVLYRLWHEEPKEDIPG